VIVVGDPGGEFARRVTQLAREWAVETVPCADVYAALVTIAAQAGRRLLVLGTLKEFVRGKQAFFAIASAHAVRCCCLLDRRSRPVQQPALLAALRTGAALAGDLQDVGDALRQWLGTVEPDGPGRERVIVPAGCRGRDAAASTDEDLRATEAELDALLR